MVRVGYSDASVTVTYADGSGSTAHAGVKVLVRSGRGRIETSRGQLVRALDGATSASRHPDGGWLVTFGSGETWLAVKTVKPCGCGGAR